MIVGPCCTYTSKTRQLPHQLNLYISNSFNSCKLPADHTVFVSKCIGWLYFAYLESQHTPSTVMFHHYINLFCCKCTYELTIQQNKSIVKWTFNELYWKNGIQAHLFWKLLDFPCYSILTPQINSISVAIWFFQNTFTDLYNFLPTTDSI